MQKSNLGLILFLALMSLNSRTWAQQSPYKIGDIICKGSVVKVLSENESFWWFGTNKGLIRINKRNQHQKIYSVHNSMMPSDEITSICCRSNGHVWIGTSNGIVIYDNYGFILVNDENSKLPGNFVTSIAEDNNEDVWIGTKANGLVKVHHSHFWLYNKSNSSLPDDQIRFIKRKTDGSLEIIGSKNDAFNSMLVSKK